MLSQGCEHINVRDYPAISESSNNTILFLVLKD